MSKPKIVVLRMRELIYTAIFALLIITLLLLLFLMFHPKESGSQSSTEIPSEKESSTEQTSAASYTPGIYTSCVSVSDHYTDIEVAVDSDKIRHIRLVNLGESVTAAFPLVEPSLDELSRQICQTQSLDGITCSRENKYTSEMLFQAIQNSLAKARR